jgi:hypothetical protein
MGNNQTKSRKPVPFSRPLASEPVQVSSKNYEKGELTAELIEKIKSKRAAKK